jgi:hypothetical protein
MARQKKTQFLLSQSSIVWGERERERIYAWPSFQDSLTKADLGLIGKERTGDDG